MTVFSDEVREAFGFTFRPDRSAGLQLMCPSCGMWAYLDDDQANGRVSTACLVEGCGCHATHDFASMLASGVGRG